MRGWTLTAALALAGWGCDAGEATSVALVGPDAARADAAVPDGAAADLGAVDAAAGGDGGGGAGGAGGGAGGAGPGGEGGGGGGGGQPAGPCRSVVQVGDLTVFQYEASRPDATADDAGSAAVADGACSQVGVLPWTNVTELEAEAACAAADFHLCTDAEWTLLCAGPEGYPYPYGEAHVAGRCNDHIGGIGYLEPTGARPECVTEQGVYDVSGNVWELNADGFRRGASWKVNAVMFHQEVAGCVEKFNINEQYYDEDLGFRCCR